MTNFDRWQRLMKDVCSPQSYIDFGFYFMISSALQRRVWTGPDHFRLYPNLFVILVGKPGLGKGVTIGPVTEMLKHHKLVKETPIEDAAVNTFMQAFDKTARDKKREELLFPIAPDATTYESLVREIALSTRHINYKKFDPAKAKEVTAIYSHASMAFTLEELSSLMCKQSHKIVNFMLVAWDCKDYDYVTKHQGEDRIKHCCLSMLAGTTPGFMEDTFTDKLIEEGFSARTIFVYETANRHNSLDRPELTAEQLEDKQVLLAHLHKLSKLYGSVKYTPEAKALRDKWYQETIIFDRLNKSPKMDPYYSKIGMQIQKLAMAIHFGESTDMIIDTPAMEKAINASASVEKNMHLALAFDGRNPLAAISRKMYSYLARNGGSTYDDLFIQFVDDVNAMELNECLNILSTDKRIKKDGDRYKVNK